MIMCLCFVSKMHMIIQFLVLDPYGISANTTQNPLERRPAVPAVVAAESVALRCGDFLEDHPRTSKWLVTCLVSPLTNYFLTGGPSCSGDSF